MERLWLSAVAEAGADGIQGGLDRRGPTYG